MPELHVRRIPVELHERLRRQAADEGRSMSAQALVLLRRGLDATDRPMTSRQAALARLDEIRSRTALPPGAPTSEELIREDRDTRC